MDRIVFSAALLTLSVEVFYTRLFSALFWKNTALALVSLAMLGIGAAGVLVYLAPRWFPAERKNRQLAWLMSVFGLSIVVSYVWILVLSRRAYGAMDPLGSYVPLVAAGLVPFFCGGLLLSLVFLHSSEDISRLYRIDLVGASLGAVLVLPLLRVLNGPMLVPFLGLVAALVALSYSRRERARGPTIFAACTALAMVGLAAWHGAANVLGVTHSHGQKEENVELERWDPLARLVVQSGEADSKWLNIDSQVATSILRYDGDADDVAYLKHNVLQLAYRLRRFPKVLIIGPGGGSDVLSAVTSGNTDITAVEVNRSTISLMRNEFRAYTGALYDLPSVKIHIEDGRAYVAAMKDKVDLIQATFVDTFTSAASGAHTLSENYLYTVEGFGDFLDHLKEGGVLSMSRWGGEVFTFAEVHRTVALVIRTLTARGAPRPSANVVVVQGAQADRLTPGGGYQNPGRLAESMTTVLVKSTPFSPEELGTLDASIRESSFRPLWLGARGGLEPVLSELFRTNDGPETLARYRADTGLDISPVTDDRPFFFDMIDPTRSLFEKPKPAWTGHMYYFARTLDIERLHELFRATAVAAFALLVLPLLGRLRDVRAVRRPVSTLGYFVYLGVGFIGIELTLMQRFALFLEHPVYSLVVFLSSILLFSGLGSASTAKIAGDWARVAPRRAVLLVGVLLAYGGAIPPLTRSLIGLPLLVKVGIAVLLAFPPAYLMGMMFPLGIAAIRGRNPRLVPWVWGLNSAFSVLGAVLSLFLAMSLGFTATWFVFVGVYALALVAMVRLSGAERS